MTTKEKIYDEQINPLMTQIIAICKEHKIANICSFCLGPDPDRDDAELVCTTALLSDEYEPDENHKAALRELDRKPMFAAFTITKPRETN